METLCECVLKVQLVGFTLLLVAYNIYICLQYLDPSRTVREGPLPLNLRYCIDLFQQWPRTDNKNSERDIPQQLKVLPQV